MWRYPTRKVHVWYPQLIIPKYSMLFFFKIATEHLTNTSRLGLVFQPQKVPVHQRTKRIPLLKKFLSLSWEPTTAFPQEMPAVLPACLHALITSAAYRPKSSHNLLTFQRFDIEHQPLATVWRNSILHESSHLRTRCWNLIWTLYRSSHFAVFQFLHWVSECRRAGIAKGSFGFDGEADPWCRVWSSGETWCRAQIWNWNLKEREKILYFISYQSKPTNRQQYELETESN